METSAGAVKRLYLCRRYLLLVPLYFERPYRVCLEIITIENEAHVSR